MGLLILLVIIFWGWAEVTAFIIIGGEIGGLLTFIGVFLTAIVGLWLLRSQAANVMANLRQQVTRGEAPLAVVAESLSLLIGGTSSNVDGRGCAHHVQALRDFRPRAPIREHGEDWPRGPFLKQSGQGLQPASLVLRPAERPRGRVPGPRSGLTRHGERQQSSHGGSRVPYGHTVVIDTLRRQIV